MSLRLAIHTVFVLVLKRRSAEINQKPILYSSRIKIVDKLCLMAGIDRRYCFQFQDEPIINNYISPIVSHTNAFVINRNWDLLFGLNAKRLQFDHQGVFIYFLKVSRAKVPMHCHRSPNDLITYFINIHNSKPC